MFRLVVLLSLASMAFAWVATGDSDLHSDYPGKCYSRDLDQAYSPGETWKIPGCVEVTCSQSNGKLLVHYAGCSPMAPPPPCRIETDESLAYPDCCGTLVCPEDQEI